MTNKNDPFHLMIVKESMISGAGLGTFATQFISKNTDFLCATHFARFIISETSAT